MAFSRPVFTNAGKELQAKALAGECEIKFTAIALGSGELITQSIAELTDLIKPIKRCELTEIKHTAIDTIQLKSKFENTSQTSGFYWREVGLFAADPNEPSNRAADILYCYQNAGDIAEYIAAPEQQIIDKILCMAIAISDSAKVSAVIKSELYADREEFNAHLIDAEAHKNIFENYVKVEHLTDANAHSNLVHYVKKSGDTMSGALVMADNAQIFKDKDDLFLGLCGGSNYNNGAFFEICGKDHAEQSGNFNIYANNGTQSARLNGTPNGSLTWQGHNIATTNGIKMQGHILKDTDDSELIIGGATVFNNGAYGAFRGVNFGVAEEAGSFAFKAQGDKQYFLKGTKDGSLKWDDKNLVRSVNGVNADTQGNVTISASTMPDYNSKVSLTRGTTYTAPCDCLVCVYGWNNEGHEAMAELRVYDSNDNEILIQQNRLKASGYQGLGSVNLPIPKGTKFSVDWAGSATYSYTCYFPLK